MSAKPMELLTLIEHPESAREKLVSLSPQGLTAVNAMAKRGEAYIQRIVDQLSSKEVAEGTRFMTRVSEITKTFQD